MEVEEAGEELEEGEDADKGEFAADVGGLFDPVAGHARAPLAVEERRDEGGGWGAAGQAGA